MSVNSRNGRIRSSGRAFLIVTLIFLITALLVAGCTTQKAVVVAPNDTVKVHYTASLASTGQQFESSLNGTPIEFVAGTGMVIKGFDNAVIGMSVGENKTVNVPADQAYGPKRQDLIITTAKTGALGRLSCPNQEPSRMLPYLCRMEASGASRLLRLTKPRSRLI